MTDRGAVAFPDGKSKEKSSLPVGGQEMDPDSLSAPWIEKG